MVYILSTVKTENTYKWHNSKRSMQLFGRNLFLFWLTVPISPRHCKEPSRQFSLACFQWEELICKASILSCKSAQA